jgi:hypothetical protein
MTRQPVDPADQSSWAHYCCTFMYPKAPKTARKGFYDVPDSSTYLSSTDGLRETRFTGANDKDAYPPGAGHT